MKVFGDLLFNTLSLLIDAMRLAMLARAVLSWFPPASGTGGPFRAFLTTVTEFCISPVRRFLERFEFVRRTPIDLSFFATFLLLSLIGALLQGVRS